MTVMSVSVHSTLTRAASSGWRMQQSRALIKSLFRAASRPGAHVAVLRSMVPEDAMFHVSWVSGTMEPM